MSSRKGYCIKEPNLSKKYSCSICFFNNNNAGSWVPCSLAHVWFYSIPALSVFDSTYYTGKHIWHISCDHCLPSTKYYILKEIMYTKCTCCPEQSGHFMSICSGLRKQQSLYAPTTSIKVLLLPNQKVGGGSRFNPLSAPSNSTAKGSQANLYDFNTAFQCLCSHCCWMKKAWHFLASWGCIPGRLLLCAVSLLYWGDGRVLQV